MKIILLSSFYKSLAFSNSTIFFNIFSVNNNKFTDNYLNENTCLAVFIILITQVVQVA